MQTGYAGRGRYVAEMLNLDIYICIYIRNANFIRAFPNNLRLLEINLHTQQYFEKQITALFTAF